MRNDSGDFAGQSTREESRPAEQVTDESILISRLQAVRLRHSYLVYLPVIRGVIQIVVSRGLCVSFILLIIIIKLMR